jgi:hypothetical protein
MIFDLLERGGALVLVTTRCPPAATHPHPRPSPILSRPRSRSSPADPFRRHRRIKQSVISARCCGQGSETEPGRRTSRRDSGQDPLQATRTRSAARPERPHPGHRQRPRISFSAPHLFGTRLGQFAAELRELLAYFSATDWFSEWPGDTEVLVAQKPASIAGQAGPQRRSAR